MLYECHPTSSSPHRLLTSLSKSTSWQQGRCIIRQPLNFGLVPSCLWRSLMRCVRGSTVNPEDFVLALAVELLTAIPLKANCQQLWLCNKVSQLAQQLSFDCVRYSGSAKASYFLDKVLWLWIMTSLLLFTVCVCRSASTAMSRFCHNNLSTHALHRLLQLSHACTSAEHLASFL